MTLKRSFTIILTAMTFLGSKEVRGCGYWGSGGGHGGGFNQPQVVMLPAAGAVGASGVGGLGGIGHIAHAASGYMAPPVPAPAPASPPAYPDYVYNDQPSSFNDYADPPADPVRVIINIHNQNGTSSINSEDDTAVRKSVGSKAKPKSPKLTVSVVAKKPVNQRLTTKRPAREPPRKPAGDPSNRRVISFPAAKPIKPLKHPVSLNVYRLPTQKNSTSTQSQAAKNKRVIKGKATKPEPSKTAGKRPNRVYNIYINRRMLGDQDPEDNRTLSQSDNDTSTESEDLSAESSTEETEENVNEPFTETIPDDYSVSSAADNNDNPIADPDIQSDSVPINRTATGLATDKMIASSTTASASLL